MALFTIKDTGITKIKDSHYYKWLAEKKVTNIHNIQTKVDYLTSQGFEVGKDRIDKDDLTILKCIEDVYFRDNLRN